jgi:hypothetical protein
MNAAGVTVSEYIFNQDLWFYNIGFIPAAPKLQCVKLCPQISFPAAANTHNNASLSE